MKAQTHTYNNNSNNNYNPLSSIQHNFKTKSVSPFEPLAKDRNYDAINGGGKISPLPQDEYEIWAKRKREIQNCRPESSFHHFHFRPLVISQKDNRVRIEEGGEEEEEEELNDNVTMTDVASHQDEGCYRNSNSNSGEVMNVSLDSVEQLKLENEYLHKKVERLERLLEKQQQQQQQRPKSSLDESSYDTQFNHFNSVESVDQYQHYDDELLQREARPKFATHLQEDDDDSSIV
mmetsp:Transcript_9096/g.17144  ORF Transcript_9096/g.17144 Transcript_9096/m.17144 type:complete len:234 (+) Transcript_9096:1106-1807(+)